MEVPVVAAFVFAHLITMEVTVNIQVSFRHKQKIAVLKFRVNEMENAISYVIKFV